MTSDAKTVEEYIESLPRDRKEAVEVVRKVILSNLPDGYEECMNCGMIGYVVPHKIYPAGYPCDPSKPLPFACLGSQKNYLSLYLMNVYGHPETKIWFQKAFKAAGKKLDMGKSCVRFKKAEDLPLEVIGEVIARTPVEKYIKFFESVNNARKKSRGSRQ